MPWEAVEAALPEAKAIVYDGCHKIYVLLDEEQAADFEGMGYPPLMVRAEESTEHKMLETLHEWYESSCPLRFISSVRTNREDPNAGFTSLISQFEE
jgi:hypothetical protein